MFRSHLRHEVWLNLVSLGNDVIYTDQQKDPCAACMLTSRTVPYLQCSRLIRHFNKSIQITFLPYILATFTCFEI